MKNKKLICTLFLLVTLICSALIYAGCSPREPSLCIYFSDNAFVPNVEYTLGVEDANWIISVEQSKVEYEILDNSAGAVLSGNTIRASETGSVRIKATYEYDGNVYEAYETIVFDTLYVEIRLGGSSYVGAQIELYGDPSVNGVSVVGVSYREVTVTSGDASLEGADGMYTITANTEGDVTVRMVCEYMGATYTFEQTFTFTRRSLQIGIFMDGEAFIGEKIKLWWEATSDGETLSELMAREVNVISGDAAIEYTGGLYEWPTITANSEGDVTVRFIFELDGFEYSYDKTFTFTRRTLQISTDATEFFVGYSINLIATMDMPEFDPSLVVYTVQSGDAVIEGSVLQAKTPGEVVISATYQQNNVTYQGNMTLQFSYGGNTIVNGEGLQALANSDGSFTLIQDIDLSSYESWTPIENFTGTLNGNGYTISGLNITAKSLEENKGLFAVLGGTVENLTLEGTVTCSGEAKNLGLLCGTNNGTVKNVTVSGTIDALYSDNVGGIAGYSGNSYVTDCTSNVTVTARDYVGGHVGYMKATRSADAVITENINHGSIIGSSYVGGLYGYFTVHGSENNEIITVTGNENDGDVVGSKDYVGGICGYMCGNSHNGGWDGWFTAYVKVIECKNEANVTGADYVGGIVGNANEHVSEISFCSNAGDITGASYVGSYAGRASGTHMKNLTNNNTITGKSYVGGIAGYAGKMDTCTNNGTVTLAGFILTEDNQTVSYAGGIAGYATGAVECVNNSPIDASAAGDYVGGIVGYVKATRSASNVFENNKNHGSIMGTAYVGGVFGYFTVSGSENNETITVTGNENDGDVVGSKDYVGGICGYMCGNSHDGGWDGWFTAYVKVIECKNEANVTGADYVGGIVGNANVHVSEIAFCSNAGDITGASYVGSYAGRAADTHMRNLTNSSTITGESYVGGIAGYAGKMDTCTNNGTVTLAGFALTEDNQTVSYAGGIAGYATGAVECVNNSPIDASAAGDYVGGIVGYVKATRSASNVFENNKNHGSITGTAYVGGVFGYFTVSGSENNETITVTGNENDGDMIGSKDYVGGICGYMCGNSYDGGWDGWFTAYVKVIECKNEANVTGSNYVGGIIGNANDNVSEISFCSTEGDITGDTYVGGYAGRANGTQMRNLTNNSTITGKSYVGGIAGYAGQLTSCVNNGNIVNEGYSLTDDNQAVSYLGGIAGYATGAVECINNNNIDASAAGDYVGGIVGYVKATRSESNVFENNKNHGSITGTAYVGGVFGYFTVSGSENKDTITVTGNENDGDVVGSKDYVGGICGYMSGNSYDGGWDGWFTAYVKVIECKNEANVTGTDYVGGLIGDCAQHVLSDEVIWNTNVFMGTITATGENQGELYGHMG